MNDEAQAPEVMVPFDPQPADLSGCGKPAVIGCLAILVLLAIGLVFFLANVRDMLDWALVQYESAVVTNISEEVTVEDRQRLERAFESARAAVRENRMEPSALQRLQRFMSSPPRPGQPVGSEKVRELSEVLESLARPGAQLPEMEPVVTPVAAVTASVHHAGV